MATLRAKLTLKDRRILRDAKAGFLRQMADFKLTAAHLAEIFGMAIRAKLHEPGNRHQSLGSNYFNAHGPHHQSRGMTHNPAGTKLTRSFIRHSGKESVYWRKLYAVYTGHQYNGEST
jgi:hypothetical protein